MKKLTTLAAAVLLFGIGVAGAQTTQTAPSNDASAVPGVSATVNNPNLAVASLKLDHGVRVGKVVGSSVYGSDGKDIGKIDDLVMTKGNEVTLAVVSVGGFLGLGSKLVAFPYSDLKQDGDRLTLPGVTADSLSAMPSFEY